jgi:DNA-binding NarL/FixJ family response regulator
MHTAATRVWIDDRHPIFRRGLRSCLSIDGLAVLGESAAFDETPTSDVDVVVFEADNGGLQRAVDLRGPGEMRLVAIVRAENERVLYDAVDAGVAAIHLRAAVRPDILASSVRAAAARSTTLPSDLIPKLLHRASTSGNHDTSVLHPRELAVLARLSQGDDTQCIATDLCYSERTVKNIVHDVLMKLNCRNRAHAVATATRQGII